MAKFCVKCGSGLDQATGLCPECDREKLNVMAAEKAVSSGPKYCVFCGSKMDPQTGKCTNPQCSNGVANAAEEAAPIESNTAPAPVETYVEPTPAETYTAPQPVQNYAPQEVYNTYPNQQANTVAVPVETPKKKAPPKKATALNTVITVLLSICLFITSIFPIVIYDIRNAIKEENVERLLEKIETIDLIEESGFIDRDSLDDFYDDMHRKFGIEITDKSLNKFIEKSSIKEFIAGKVAEFCDEFYNKGDAEIKITKREAIDLLNDNSIIEEDDYESYLRDELIVGMVTWIFDGEDIVIIDTDQIKENLTPVYYGVNFGLSYVTMAIFILLCLLIIFFMIKNSFSQAVCGIGTVFVILGGITGLVAMLAAWIPLLWETISGDSIIGTVVGEFMVINSTPSIILFVLGLVMLILRGLVKKIRAKNAE